mgnify:CR=1 FL=1
MSEYDKLVNWLSDNHPEVFSQWATYLDCKEING